MFTLPNWLDRPIPQPKRRPRFEAPQPFDGELHDRYLLRIAIAFEDWVNDAAR